MEALFRQLVVGVVPQLVPPAALPRDALQRAFLDIGEEYPYQQFQVLPGDSGAQLSNSPSDLVIMQPGVFQVQTPVELTPELARTKAQAILNTVSKRLKVENYLTCGIKVVAHVSAPGPVPDAKAFISGQVMRAGELAHELGPNFYGGGVKYRSFSDDLSLEENLSLEPWIGDNQFIYVDFDVQRRIPFQGLGDLSAWLDDAFSFVSGPTMRVIDEQAGNS
ncbi:MAG: hypothetical protein WKF33_10785 [Thermoleophilaceae bacterium]